LTDALRNVNASDVELNLDVSTEAAQKIRNIEAKVKSETEQMEQASKQKPVAEDHMEQLRATAERALEEKVHHIAEKKAQKAAAKQEPPACCCCIAFFRYHLFPYDHGFWGRNRDPIYVIFRILTFIPLCGVSPITYLFTFFIIDKRDEYQLVQFIISFKGMQFLSMGIIRTLLGFFQFIHCLTAVARDPGDPKFNGMSTHKCEDEGPGNSGWSFYPALFGFLIQVVLCWIAMALLRCSKEKGRSLLKGEVGHEHSVRNRDQGGSIIYFLWYDLFAFTLCLAAALWIASLRDMDMDDWPTRHAFFAAQVTYGLLSFPFFLFSIPGLVRVVTHSMPTAYDKEGRTVKPVTPEPAEWRKEERKKNMKGLDEENLISGDDGNSIMGGLKKGLGIPL
jgi:hypothetical protein